VKEKKTSAIAESFLSGNCAEEEAIIQPASYHVEQAKVVRELAQRHAHEAKDDIDNGILHPNKKSIAWSVTMPRTSGIHTSGKIILVIQFIIRR
jgi:hypothetical protein